MSKYIKRQKNEMEKMEQLVAGLSEDMREMASAYPFDEKLQLLQQMSQQNSARGGTPLYIIYCLC